ncbi:MAG: CDP-glycerol glycerophosphotransferase family protein [Treponema sp.]|nr:CDP-glycerol glycerophosphotransferase family protein [Treponema sp.]
MFEPTKATSKKERAYINKRKRKAFRESLCFYLCGIFPIKKNLVSLCTFEGKGGFCCNPKYLALKLHERNPKLEFVWFVNDMSKKFPSWIKKVPNTLWSRAYWLSRSKVWIDNYRKPYGTVKRKSQYYLNVNHYTIGIKCTGLYRGSGFSEMAYLVSKNDSDMVDDFVIDSDWCEQISPKALVYSGTYQKTGAPRCDILYGDRTEQKKLFRQKHHLPLDARILMYAPTFREGAENGKRFVFSEVWSIDFEKLLKEMESKFSGKWYLCVRVHPQLAPTFKVYKNPAIQDRLIDESQADDMYEILAGMDAYITDYSSACFEAAFAKIPVFLYADDVLKYAKDRGQLMWNLATDERHNIGNNKDITPMFDVKLPFTLAYNNEQLFDDIRNFNKAEYDQKLDKFYAELGLIFDGNASTKLSDMIIEKIGSLILS